MLTFQDLKYHDELEDAFVWLYHEIIKPHKSSIINNGFYNLDGFEKFYPFEFTIIKHFHNIYTILVIMSCDCHLDEYNPNEFNVWDFFELILENKGNNIIPWKGVHCSRRHLIDFIPKLLNIRHFDNTLERLYIDESIEKEYLDIVNKHSPSV